MQGSSDNGVPAGTGIIWTTENWQQDMKTAGGHPDHWLECNGQVVDRHKYPKLYKIMTHTPNYQGLFLRSRGGNAASIGQIQEDAIRNITGTLDPGHGQDGTRNQLFGETPTATGVFENYDWFFGSNGADSGLYWRANGLLFDASRVVPTSNENRPINTAVVFLIKAK